MGASLTWDQVFAWRLRRQHLEPPAATSAVEVVRAVAGVQAQVASAAETAVAVRRATPRLGEATEALTRRRLVKTWAMRGTLHLLATGDAPAYLALMAAARSWEKPSWVKAFAVTPAEMAALGEAVAELLEDRALTREELVTGLTGRTAFAGMGEQLRSGWGAVLKPLAWQGRLCHGPGQGNRVTFASPAGFLPGWTGLPAVEEAAASVVPAYLAAHGPASPETFDRWLTRAMHRRATVREWFAALGDRVTPVEVEGQPAVILAEHLDDLLATRPSKAVRLLPAFDQYVLGPGTQDEHLVTPARRGEVSRAAGWIAPVVVARGRVAGTWETQGETLAVTWFEEAGRVPRTALQAEARRLGGILGRELTLAAGA